MTLDPRVRALAAALIAERIPALHPDDVREYVHGLSRQIHVAIEDYLLVYGRPSPVRDVLAARWAAMRRTGSGLSSNHPARLHGQGGTRHA